MFSDQLVFVPGRENGVISGVLYNGNVSLFLLEEGEGNAFFPLNVGGGEHELFKKNRILGKTFRVGIQIDCCWRERNAIS